MILCLIGKPFYCIIKHICVANEKSQIEMIYYDIHNFVNQIQHPLNLILSKCLSHGQYLLTA